MKKKSFIITIIALVVIMSVIVTAASVYFSKQARMNLFSGRIEQSGSKPDDPKLVLKIAGESVGQDSSVSNYNEAIFPILTHIESASTAGKTVWKDESGREPLYAPTFMLSAENGEVKGVNYKIVIDGDTSAASALRFGIDVKYYSEETGYKHSLSGVIYLDDTKNFKESTMEVLGDGNVKNGEDIEIRVCAWVDSYALADLGDYNADADFSVSIVFVAT